MLGRKERTSWSQNIGHNVLFSGSTMLPRRKDKINHQSKMSQQTNTNNLRHVSYNCKSLKARKKEIYYLCSKNDIVMLQEHWLFGNELDILKTFYTDVDCHSISAMNPSRDLFLGRPYDGVAIMYRKSLQNVIKLCLQMCICLMIKKRILQNI